MISSISSLRASEGVYALSCDSHVMLLPLRAGDIVFGLLCMAMVVFLKVPYIVHVELLHVVPMCSYNVRVHISFCEVHAHFYIIQMYMCTCKCVCTAMYFPLHFTEGYKSVVYMCSAVTDVIYTHVQCIYIH